MVLLKEKFNILSLVDILSSIHKENG